jgi:hypothetical protein
LEIERSGDSKMSVSKMVRFEVFKRDSFTCQYCGRKAPDVILEADHVHPRAKGGTDDVLNLVTSCKDCNSGKRDRLLSETAVIDKQRAQLEELQERREQIDMMFQWQESLLEIQGDVVDRLHGVWRDATGYCLNEHGRKELKKHAKRFGIDELITAIHTAADQYLDRDDDGVVLRETVELAWKRVPGICRMNRLEKDNPDLKRLYYVRGIIRNRFNYCNDVMAINLLKRAHECNASIESLEDFARSSRNWTQWRDGMEEFIAKHDLPDQSNELGG